MENVEPVHERGGTVAFLDGARVSRSITRQLTAAGVLATLWVVLVGAEEHAVAAGLAFAIAPFAFVLWQRLAPTEDGSVLIKTGLIGGGVLVLATSALVGIRHSPFLLFSIWLVPWAFIVWSKRGGATYVVALTVGFAVLRGLQGNVPASGLLYRELPALVVGVGGLVAVGVVVRILVDHLAELHASARCAARSQGLVAELARHALEETAADETLSREAGRVLTEALEAELAVVADGGVDGGTRLAATPATLVIPIGRPLAGNSQLLVSRPGRPFGGDEVAVAQAVADVLAVAQRRVSAERERRHRAGHDELTGLPGRERFAQKFADVLGAGSGANVLVIDIDDFVLVNETQGPRAGDALLQAVAERLRGAADPDATIARFGGDEFALLDPGGHGELQAVDLARRVQAALQPPFDLGTTREHVSASIGIALCEPGRDPREAIRDAHLAQRRAREQGRGRYEVFESRIRHGLEHRRTVENELRRALEQGEFRLVYQPVVDLFSGRVRGAEALLRWQHPTRGMVAPGEFIDVAEESDLIVPIGGWVLRQVLRQLKAWQVGGLSPGTFQLGVNISGRQLADRRFVPMLRAQLSKYALDPGSLMCELTETALIDETPQVEAAVAEMKAMGVQLALDDFGSGYASLRYVRRFQFDSLKLDRSFVAGLGENRDDIAIIAAAISMGTALNMGVVAEGVETAEQAARLRSMNCPHAQGFLFARPMDASALHALLAAQQARERSAGARVTGEAAVREQHPDDGAGAGLTLELEAPAERIDSLPR